MCKGNLRTKAECFFEIASGTLDNEGSDTPVEIAFNSGRLTKAFKMVIFFSEIFPKKYQNEFLEDIHDKIDFEKKAALDKSFWSISTSPKQEKNDKSQNVETSDIDGIKNIYWTDVYLILAEENFDKIFESLY